MIKLVVVLLLLAPSGFCQTPKLLEKPWTVKSGLIFDANGKEVGIYGVDVSPNLLRR